jgi:hypothetical protein
VANRDGAGAAGRRLGEAVDSLRRFVLANATSDDQPAYDAILAAAGRKLLDEKRLDGTVR